MVRARLDDLLDFDGDGFAGGAVGAEGDEAVAVAIVDRPEGVAVGFGDRQGGNFFAGEETETALVDVGGKRGDRPAAAEEEHEPVRLALVGFFGDHREEVEVGGGDFEAGLFAGFADGALKGGFAGGGFEFAADGAPDAEIRRFGAEEEQVLAGSVFEEDENGDFVGEGGGHEDKGKRSVRRGEGRTTTFWRSGVMNEAAEVGGRREIVRDGAKHLHKVGGRPLHARQLR